MNRIAIITGSTTGIGFETALSFLRTGYSVVLNGRNSHRINMAQKILSEQFEGRFKIVQGDIAEEKTQIALFEECDNSFGSLPDTIIVNAGRGMAGSVVNADLSGLDEMIRTNLTAAITFLQISARKFIERRNSGYPRENPLDIVLLSSISGKQISPWSGVYGSTKFAISSLSESLRRELAPHMIRVSLVAPAIVESDFQEVAGYDPDWFNGIREKIGPLLLPRDVASLISFIVSQPPHVHINDVTIRPTRQDTP